MNVIIPEKEQLGETSTPSSPTACSDSICSQHGRPLDQNPEKAFPLELGRVLSRQTMGRTVSAGTAGTNDPGFEIDWDGEDDPQNPQNWSSLYKALVVGTLSWSTWV